MPSAGGASQCSGPFGGSAEHDACLLPIAMAGSPMRAPICGFSTKPRDDAAFGPAESCVIPQLIISTSMRSPVSLEIHTGQPHGWSLPLDPVPVPGEDSRER